MCEGLENIEKPVMLTEGQKCLAFTSLDVQNKIQFGDEICITIFFYTLTNPWYQMSLYDVRVAKS